MYHATFFWSARFLLKNQLMWLPLYVTIFFSLGLMKKRSCSALPWYVPCSPEPDTSGVSPTCVACAPTTVAQLCLSSVQSSAIALFACCGECLVPVLLVGQSGASLRLSCTRPGICQSCCSTKPQYTFFVLSPEKLSLIGRACSQARCLPTAHCWGYSQTGVYGYLHISPG